MPEFVYSQRPFRSDLTEDQYSVAVGRTSDVALAHSAFITGHECNGTYKTFAAEHCPYCQRKPHHPADRCSAPSCGICKY